MTLQLPLRLLLSLASGLALALAFPSYNFPLLAWGAVAGLMLATSGARPRPAALFGFLHGATFFTASVPWVYTVMRVHGRVPLVAAVGILVLLAAAGGLFHAAFALTVAWLGRSSVERACLAAPFLWVAQEFARTHLPHIGFPWNLLGYAAAVNLGLVQITSLTGIYGLSFLVAAYNALFVWVAYALPGARRRAVAAWLSVTAALLLAAYVGPKFVPIEPAGHFARLVQTNFPQEMSYPGDWLERHAAELDQLEQLSVAVSGTSPELIVWPEVPAPFYSQDQRFAARAERVARATPDGFLVGIVDWKPGPHGGLAPYNSAALLNPAGRQVFLYDKIHLVPFGEYVPLRRWLRFAGKLTAEVGDFQPGSEYRVGDLRGGTFGVFICYEAVFPGEVRRFVHGGAGLLFNLSNDGWFGRSAAPEQHLAMARVRAVENRRWLLRATNNGFTVAVDPYGRYVARLAPDVRGTLDAPYGFRTDLTLYARWGDWLAWLCVATSAYFLLFGPRHRMRAPAAGWRHKNPAARERRK